ncbi:hypothetical protein R1flu_018864 [Riccia fluitans]|uniref:Myb-like domain-containing protein n=1 Tax=Riccia fluitans TaxID=41844 RepID=A0ABD1ZJB2_9MARC
MQMTNRPTTDPSNTLGTPITQAVLQDISNRSHFDGKTGVERGEKLTENSGENVKEVGSSSFNPQQPSSIKGIGSSSFNASAHQPSHPVREIPSGSSSSYAEQPRPDLRISSYDRQLHVTAGQIGTLSEDEQMIELVGLVGIPRWAAIARSMPGRNAKQCRDRSESAVKNRWNILVKRKSNELEASYTAWHAKRATPVLAIVEQVPVLPVQQAVPEIANQPMEIIAHQLRDQLTVENIHKFEVNELSM